MSLEALRTRIDAVDQQIVALLNERVRLAGEVGEVKRGQGADYYVPAREEQVFRRLTQSNQGPLTDKALRMIYREIISASIALEKPLTIAYLGPEATYTHQASLAAFGSSLTHRPVPTIADVFAAVEKGEADYGVIPVENSTEGAVFHSLDMFIESELKIVSQVYLPIEHCLISHSPLEKIGKVVSKDQALGQCRKWLQRNLSHAVLVNHSSTAEGVKWASREPEVAAIASRLAAELYQVPVVAAGIQDKADNVTRFLVIGPRPAPGCEGSTDRTSIVVSINDRVGALHDALLPFSKRGINLQKIESRPSRRKVWDYYFFIDFCGHWEDPLVQEAVAELQTVCPLVKWLGSYPENAPRQSVLDAG